MSLLFMKNKGWTKEKVEEWVGKNPEFSQTGELPPTEPPIPEPEPPKPLCFLINTNKVTTKNKGKITHDGNSGMTSKVFSAKENDFR